MENSDSLYEIWLHELSLSRKATICKSGDCLYNVQQLLQQLFLLCRLYLMRSIAYDNVKAIGPLQQTFRSFLICGKKNFYGVLVWKKAFPSRPSWPCWGNSRNLGWTTMRLSTYLLNQETGRPGEKIVPMLKRRTTKTYHAPQHEAKSRGKNHMLPVGYETANSAVLDVLIQKPCQEYLEHRRPVLSSRDRCPFSRQPNNQCTICNCLLF